MKPSLLLPNKYKLIGLLLLLPSLLLGIAVRFYDFKADFLTMKNPIKTSDPLSGATINFTDEVALTGLIVGLLFIAFAREKQEDEYIRSVRLESLQWAVLVNYILLLLATWLVHNFAYLDVMVYNMLTILIFFIIRFAVMLHRNKSIITE
jgi:hypothetical protein